MVTRRSTLRWIGSLAGLAATAGCLDTGISDEHRLLAQKLDELGAAFLRADPTRIPATTRVDLATETKQQYVTELFESGTVTVRQWPLVELENWGKQTRPRPTFLEQDGRYYEVTLEDERTLDRERWVFAVERVDELPTDATADSTPFAGLSEQDTRVLEAALDAVYAGNDGFLGEPEFDELQTVQFHQDLSVEKSGLVPSPPFAFIEYQNDTYRVIATQRTVSIAEWTYALEPVARSDATFQTYLRETVPETTLTESELSDGAIDVLDTAVREGRYRENGQLSDELSEVLDELGIGAALAPLESYQKRTEFRGVVAAYADSLYQFDFLVFE